MGINILIDVGKKKRTPQQKFRRQQDHNLEVLVVWLRPPWTATPAEPPLLPAWRAPSHQPFRLLHLDSSLLSAASFHSPPSVLQQSPRVAMSTPLRSVLSSFSRPALLLAFAPSLSPPGSFCAKRIDLKYKSNPTVLLLLSCQRSPEFPGSNPNSRAFLPSSPGGFLVPFRGLVESSPPL